MQVDSQCRTVILEALSKGAPALRQYFQELLAHKQSYTVQELNSIFRYEIIRLTPSGINTVGVREWLYNYPTVNDWLRYFIPNVLPLIRSYICNLRMSSYVIK